MLTDGDLSRLLFLLHSAPLEEGKWQEFLDELTRLTQTSAGFLICQEANLTRHSILAFFGYDADPCIPELYNKQYASFDPFREHF